MLAHILPGVLRPRAGFIVTAALLSGSLLISGGIGSVRAAAPGSSAKPPSVDAAYKEVHPPRYPIEALEKGEQGTVMLKVTVDASGNVVNVAVDPKGTDAATVLQSAAIAAASKWRFNPGMQDGHPVGGVVEVPVSFGIATPCSAGFKAVGRAAGRYGCIPTSSGVPNTPGKCLDGFRYKQGKGKSYSCFPAQPSTSTPPASSAF